MKNGITIMATVYFVKEGLDRTDSYRAFASMPISDLESKFKEKKIVYLGTIRPALNIEPSMYEERVVVEVESTEPLGKCFCRAGFFIVDALILDRDRQPNYSSERHEMSPT
jgi:hypothetical protein